MRVVGPALRLPCAECGSECKPTERLSGQPPSGRTHPMVVYVSEDTFTSLRRAEPGKKAATVAGETLDKIFRKTVDKTSEAP